MPRWRGGGWTLQYRSKGREQRVQQYEQRRKAAIDEALPVAREGLSKLIAGVKAARERGASMQQESLRGLARGFAPVSVPATETQLGAFQGRAPQDVRTEAGGRVAQQYFGPEAVAQRTATLENLRAQHREAGLFDPLFVAREVLRPVTEPIGRFTGRNIVPNLPVVGPLAGLIPERQRERVGEAVAPDVLDPMNLLPGIGFTKLGRGARAIEGVADIAGPGAISRIGSFLRGGERAGVPLAERAGVSPAAILERVQAERAAPEAALARVQEARTGPAATLARVQEARGTAPDLAAEVVQRRAGIEAERGFPPAPREAPLAALPERGAAAVEPAAREAAAAPPLGARAAEEAIPPAGARQEAAALPLEAAAALPEPPEIGGAATGAGQFSRATEQLLQRAEDTNVDRNLFDYATSRAAQPAQQPGRAAQVFNKARALVDPALARDPDLNLSYLAASRYGEAQVQRINGTVAGFEGAVREAFGEAGLRGQPVLRAQYIGPPTAGKAIDRYVGTVWHYIDNPSLYKGATREQHDLAATWDSITRHDLRFFNDVGGDLAEWEGFWMRHSFRDPERAASVLARPGGGRGRPGFFKERKLDTESYAEVAQQHGLDIETNVVDLLARRLTGTARARSNMVFLDQLAQKVGGARATAAKVPIGEGIVQSGGQTWRFPKKIADEVNAALTRPMLQPDEKLASQAVDAARGVLLNLDFSVGGLRQGYLGFVSDPIGAIKSYGQAGAILGSRDGWLQWYAQNGPRMEYWANHGLTIRTAPTDITATLRGQRKELIERLPGIGQLNEIQFNVIMPLQKVGRADMYQGLLQSIRDDKGLAGLAHNLPVVGPIVKRLGGNLVKMSDDAIADVVADGMNNWMGGIEWARIGKTPGLLSKLAILTEGWTRAQMGVLINAPKLSPKGILARRMLMQEVALTAAASTALSLGMTGQLPNYDPRSVDFLDVVTPSGRVSILPHKTILRTVIRGIAGKPPDEYGPAGALAGRWDAAYKFFEGRTGQVPRMAVDLIKGTDYFGRPIESKWQYAIKEMLPIIAGQVWDDLKTLARGGITKTEVRDIGLRTAWEFGGASAKPFRRAELAERRFNELDIPFNKDTWRDIAAKRPDLQDLLGEPSEKKQRAAAISEQQARAIFDDRLLNAVRRGDPDAGAAFRERYTEDFQNQRVGGADAVYYGSKFPEPDRPEARIKQQLFDLRPENFPSADNEFEPDWEAFHAAQAALVRQMPQSWQDAYNTQAYYLPTDMQDVERQYRQAQDERDQLADSSPVQGLSADQYGEVQDFLVKVRDFTGRLRVERQIADPDPQQVIAYVAQHYGETDPNFLDWVDYVRRGIKDADRNREYDRFILSHQRTLGLFYPELYRRKSIQLGMQSGEPVYETPAGESYGSYGSTGSYGSYGSYGR